MQPLFWLMLTKTNFTSGCANILRGSEVGVWQQWQGRRHLQLLRVGWVQICIGACFS